MRKSRDEGQLQHGDHFIAAHAEEDLVAPLRVDVTEGGFIPGARCALQTLAPSARDVLRQEQEDRRQVFDSCRTEGDREGICRMWSAGGRGASAEGHTCMFMMSV